MSPICASLPLMASDTQSFAQNYFDCTESNGEDDEDEDEGDEEGKGDAQKEVESKGIGSCQAPKWDDFFAVEALTDSQNSLKSERQSCCSLTSASPSRATGSQTPELFSDEEETPDNNENFSLTLSSSLSNHSSQNMDSQLPDTLILRPEQGGRERGDSRAQNHGSDEAVVQSEMEELSASQASSDFDIPCTPESQVPRPEELSQLYRKLASGEEVMIRKGSQGSV